MSDHDVWRRTGDRDDQNATKRMLDLKLTEGVILRATGLRRLRPEMMLEVRVNDRATLATLRVYAFDGGPLVVGPIEIDLTDPAV